MGDHKPKLKNVWPQFVVPDIQRSLEHYRDKFGFEIKWAWGDPPTYACAERNDVAIHFVAGETGGQSNAAVREGSTDIYIEAKRIDALYEELTGRGANVILEIASRDYGMRDFAVMDGDGYRISFGEEVEKSHPAPIHSGVGQER